MKPSRLLGALVAAGLCCGLACAQEPDVVEEMIGHMPRDVPKDHWAFDAVVELYDAGILEGFPGGVFQGDIPLTRYELAAGLARLLHEIRRDLSAGTTGPDGSLGSTGIQGAAGPRGAAGQLGIPGPRGPHGDPGPRGGPGIEGLVHAAGSSAVQDLVDETLWRRKCIDARALQNAVDALRGWLQPELSLFRERFCGLAEVVASLEAQVAALEDRETTVSGGLYPVFAVSSSAGTLGGLLDRAQVALANSTYVELVVTKRINARTTVGVVLLENNNADVSFLAPDEAWVEVQDTQVFGSAVDLTIGRQYGSYGHSLTFDNESLAVDALRARWTSTGLDELELWVGGAAGIRPHAIVRLGDTLGSNEEVHAGLTWIWNDSSGYGGFEKGQELGRAGVDLTWNWNEDEGRALRAEVSFPVNALSARNLAWYLGLDLVRGAHWNVSAHAASLPTGANPGSDGLTLATPTVVTYNEPFLAETTVPGSVYQPGFWSQHADYRLPLTWGESAVWLQALYHGDGRDWRLRLVREDDGRASRWTGIAGFTVNVHGDFAADFDLGVTGFSAGNATHYGGLVRGMASWEF